VPIDLSTADQQAAWGRLAVLTSKRQLTGAESDELVWLYQQTATDLATVQATAPDPTLIGQLSTLLHRARGRITGAHTPSLLAVKRFLLVDVPAALYRIRWWVGGVAIGFCLIALLAGWHVATTPGGLAMLGTAAERQQYVNDAFAAYYDPGASFAALVWTNNAWLAAMTIAFGITGVFPVYSLLNNAVNVGAMGGMMAHYGELVLFLQLIAPHGLLELTSIFVAGGAGLKLFWTLIAPGARRRSVAIAQEGRSLFTLVIGLAITLAASGLVEGFVTGSALPWGAKIAIGFVVWASFLAYVLVFGRRAFLAGVTGDLAADRVGHSAIIAG